MEELWKLIPKTNKRYSVSNLGNVRNNLTDKLLTPYNNGKGYLQVNFQVEVDEGEWKRKGMLVHRLVMEAFKGKAPKGFPEVNHIDEDPTNNALSNLEYIDRMGNMLHNNLSAKLKEASRKPIQGIGDNGERVYFLSIKDASREGFNLGGIARSLKHGTKHKGFVWKYV